MEIPAIHLEDRNAMVRHFKRLARFLIGNDAMERIERESEQWFGNVTNKN